jgi:hypothetical protein
MHASMMRLNMIGHQAPDGSVSPRLHVPPLLDAKMTPWAGLTSVDVANTKSLQMRRHSTLSVTNKIMLDSAKFEPPTPHLGMLIPYFPTKPWEDRIPTTECESVVFNRS